MIGKIIKKQTEIKADMETVVRHFLKENDEFPSSINVKVSSVKGSNKVRILVDIKD